MHSVDEFPVDCTFPICQLLPKKETGVKDFLTKFPKYDGTDVLIAVLDTGVDPAVPGLQVTSSGQHKIVDIVDCTGAGDVDTSTIKTPDDNDVIVGLTGRKLKIPASWVNPSKKYHLGIKDIFDLYPKNLKERVKKERKEKLWDPLHRLAVADVSRQMEAFEKENGLNPEDIDKWKKEDLSSLSDILKSLDKDYNDCGFVSDCVVFHDGKTWKACIDTTCRGNLEKCKLLASYRENFDYAQFTPDDLFTYSVNVYQNGNLLEIATTSGSHGTHVASIAAAYFPNDHDKNGIAPGAQVVALVVGDNRLSSMETGASLTRAINKCIELKVDIINYSYGESVHFVDTGRIVKAIEEAVFKHGIIFISSAGNNGPALSTLGCPGGTISGCIGVGAYLSSDMMCTMYSLREKLPSVLYPWSARGPAPDGALGVSISAPGAAITSVPNWTLKCSQLQNGTSMSSPNVAGAVACILSCLKGEDVEYSAFSLKRALENSAKKSEKHDFFSIGHGLIQVEDCVNHMRTYSKFLDSDVHYKIIVDNKNRGVYLRELHQLQRPREITIAVEPVFKDSIDNVEKVNFEKHFVLTCKENWVEFPSHFEIANQQRQFNIKIDPINFEKNAVYFTEILAFDVFHVDVGPLWRLPITVVYPDTVSDTVRNSVVVEKLFFKPSAVYRHFIHVPEHADWAVLKFQSGDAEKFSRFVFHALQLVPNKSYRSTESYKIATLSENGETVQSFSVVGGRTLEMCIVKWWSSLGDTFAKFELTFHGLSPSSNEITMLSANQVQRLDVFSKLTYEEASPCVTLKYACQPLRPAESKISALGTRDLFQDGRQIYHLILTYNFSVAKSSEVTPLFGALSDYLYENEYDSQIWMIFSQNRQFLFAGDAYPGRYSTKLEKGDYVLMLQLRHEDKEMLEKMKDLSAVIQYKLQNTISLDCYPSWTAALTPATGKKFGTAIVPLGATVPIYFTGVPDDKLPSSCTAGWHLTGCLTLAKDEFGKRVSQYGFTYVVLDVAKKPKSTESSDKTEKTIQQKFEEAVRELKITWISRLDAENSVAIYDELTSKYEDHLPIYLARLRSLVEKGAVKQRNGIIKVSDQIIAKIDKTSVLEYFGAKSDLSSDASATKTEMDKKKQALVEALVCKGGVICDYVLSHMSDVPACFRKGCPIKVPSTPKIDSSNKDASESNKEGNKSEKDDEDKIATAEVKSVTARDSAVSVDEEKSETASVIDVTASDVDDGKRYSTKDVDEIFVDMLKFIDASDSKVVLFSIKHAVIHQNFGKALAHLKKLVEDKPSKELELMAVEIFDHLGWTHISSYHRNWIFVRYPSVYRLF